MVWRIQMNNDTEKRPTNIEKFFREWVNEIGAAKHLTQGKVIVSISKIEEYLKYL